MTYIRKFSSLVKSNFIYFIFIYFWGWRLYQTVKILTYTETSVQNIQMECCKCHQTKINSWPGSISLYFATFMSYRNKTVTGEMFMQKVVYHRCHFLYDNFVLLTGEDHRAWSYQNLSGCYLQLDICNRNSKRLHDRVFLFIKFLITCLCNLNIEKAFNLNKIIRFVLLKPLRFTTHISCYKTRSFNPLFMPPKYREDFKTKVKSAIFSKISNIFSG